MGTTSNARIAIVDHVRQAFLGPAYDQKAYCPVAPPLIEWDLQDPANTAPFTPEEVVNTTGYVGLVLEERLREPMKVLSGEMIISGSPRVATSYYVYLDVRHLVRVPGSASPSLLETYADLIVKTWERANLTYYSDFIDDDLSIIHWPGKYPNRISGIGGFGDWFQQIIDVTLRQRVIVPRN